MVNFTNELPALHPAQRRRIADTLPLQPAHEVVLRPLGGGDATTVIVSLHEEAFLPALFDDLRADDWRARLAARRGLRRGTDGRLELGLPVHRHFQVALFELVCRVPGLPPVDPRKLDGAGLVLRRVNAVDGALLGWMKSAGQPLGWRFAAPPPSGSTSADPDPDPARRAGASDPATARLATQLATRRGSPALPSEASVPLFVAPPDICKARGRTIVYGVVPVASSESSNTTEAPDFTALPDAGEQALVIQHLSAYLKARPDVSMPRAGVLLDPTWNVLQPAADGDVDGSRLNAFGLFLQQSQMELGAFSGGAAARALLGELRQLWPPMGSDAGGVPRPAVNAADFLTAAADILLNGNANTSGLVMPIEWPRIDPSLGARLTRCALACLSARFRDVAGPTPKFDRDEALYVVRGFARVKNHGACAPALVWSNAYAEPFRILPWWDGDGPPIRVSLPPLSRLRSLKPSVTFAMPAELANLLRGDMKKLASGDGSPPSGGGIGWLCSFSLPIITLCAFIVLNIFLSLFNICFFWMAYLKICIPYPKPK